MITVFFKLKGRVRLLLAGLLAGMLIAGSPRVASAAGSPFIGEISCGGWNFCPNGWAECNGQLLDIAENDTLYNLIGTTYGGDGVEKFAMPNLSGRTMIHQGTGSTGTTYAQGQSGGTETVTLTGNQIPIHTHPVLAQTGTGDAASPANKVPASVPAGDSRYATGSTGNLANTAVGSAGGNQPHNNLQPYLAVKCCISLYGVWPVQN